jgi:hypothetical protein
MGMRINTFRLTIAVVFLITAIISTVRTGNFTPEIGPVVSMILYCFFLLVLALSFDEK